MIELPYVVGNYGDIVFVRLGDGEVKSGRLGGVRVTQLSSYKSDKVKVELGVDWTTMGSRKQALEWFNPEFVFMTAEDAFHSTNVAAMYVWPPKSAPRKPGP